MKRYLSLVLVCFFAPAAFCADAGGPAIIPAPEKMEIQKGQLELTRGWHIEADKVSVETGQFLAAQLRASTGYPLPLWTNETPKFLKGTIWLTTNGAKPSLGPEGYELDACMDGINITAPTQAGLFYGCQTLLQLFPPEIFSKAPVTNVSWRIPYCVHIEDRPRFVWRGFMLDVSRHFFSKDEVKRVLDLMALHKLNRFHWHLTDDQGWRIEIKKYPRLTEIGAWRTQSQLTFPPDEVIRPEDNIHPPWLAAPPTAYGQDGRYGGFYTQADIREIVAYAAERRITIVPEIEMPGHAVAALAAYPQLSCDGGHYSTDVRSGVNKGVFCVGNDAVITFLQNVLTEVFQLFPGKYIHIGGDEVNTAVKEATWGKCVSCQARMKAEGLTNLDQLQGWFTGQMGKFISAHGKTLIGWSEIAESPLPKDAAVMDWIGGAREAATNGHDVVMSPTKYGYFDYYQSLDHGTEPPAFPFGAAIPLDKVYSFEPIPVRLAPQFQSHILGAQANLWTEHIASLPYAEYMTFPRLSALAEVVWSPKAAREWNDFSRRLKIHELRLQQLDVNYRRDLSVKIGEWIPSQLTTNTAGTNLEWNVTSEIKGVGQYRVTFEHTDGSGLVINGVSLLQDAVEVAKDGHMGFAARHPTAPIYILNLPKSADANYILRANVIGTNSSGTVLWVFRRDVGTK